MQNSEFTRNIDESCCNDLRRYITTLSLDIVREGV